MKILLSGIAALLCITAAAAPVRLEQDASGNWRLFADGKPFQVRGVGRFDQPELARRCGVNTLRTYSSNDPERALREMDAAQRSGFKVIRGIWLQRESKNFSYKNPVHLQEQREIFADRFGRCVTILRCSAGGSATKPKAPVPRSCIRSTGRN